MLCVGRFKTHTAGANPDDRCGVSAEKTGNAALSKANRRFAFFSARREILLFAAVFIIMLIFSGMTPLLADDYNYRISWSSNQRITEVSEIFRSMEVHWRATHGRVIASGLAAYFLMLPKYVFNIVNALAAVWIVYSGFWICSLFTDSRKKAFWPALAFLTILWNFTPAFGQIFLWLDGACNYSWTLAFIYAFLMPFFAEYSDKDVRLHPLVVFLLFFEAFAAGAYSESGSISAIFIAGCLLLLVTIRRRRLPSPVLILNLIIACLGFLWMMTAPSMRGRGDFSSVSIHGLLEIGHKILDFLTARLGSALFCGLLILGLLILVALVLTYKRRRLFYALLYLGLIIGSFFMFFLFVLPDLLEANSAAAKLHVLITSPAGNVLATCFLFAALFLAALYFRVDSKILLLALVLFMGGAGSAAAFLFARYIPARGFLYLTAHFGLACSLLILGFAKLGHFRTTRTFTAVLLLIFVVCFRVGAADIADLHGQFLEREQLVAAAKAEGIEDLVLPTYSVATKYGAVHGLNDLGNADDWPTGLIAEYYGLHTITGISPTG